MNILETIEREQLKKEIPDFRVGDTVNVHTKIKELDAEGKPRERIQVFMGIVIGRSGRSIHETFTVRRISYGEGVERVFPLHSPFVEKIEVQRRGQVRRAKLYYLRERIGKNATKVKEKLRQIPGSTAASATGGGSPSATPTPGVVAAKPAEATA